MLPFEKVESIISVVKIVLLERTVFQISPFEKREFVMLTLSKSVSLMFPFEKSESVIATFATVESEIVPFEKSVVTIWLFPQILRVQKQNGSRNYLENK